MIKERLFGFWKYSSFPFVLCAEITEFRSCGLIAVEGYGNRIFKPILILKYKEGIQLKDKLKKMTTAYNCEMKVLKEEHERAVKNLMNL